ncbi:MAG: PfkB family carbohydrate kinase [Candidatus Thorarchaeota archaeon]|nr:PfkB family carbohydrate kinase [Candidatus Thorarchaeota archaeon]
MRPDDQLWPYLMFLPLNLGEKQKFIKSVLASKVSSSVLSSFDERGRVFQKDLVQNLNHSNKSILAYIGFLQKYGLVSSGSEIQGGKRVVFHELTKTGWGVARMFFEGLPSDISELTSFLFEDYLTHIVSLFREQNLSGTPLFEIFAKARARSLLEGSQDYEDPDFLLFGASSFYTVVKCDTIPNVDETARCETPVRFPGGPTIEVATRLANMGLRVAFVSSVGNDQDGWNLISDLIQRNVDVSSISVEDNKHTNETVLLGNNKRFRSMIGVDSDAALSITSPSQVPWSKLEKTKVVYIGEVFIEVASTVAAFAKSSNIPVVYQCSVPFLEMGMDLLEPILKNVDILLLSLQGLSYLRKTMKKNMIPSLRKYTNAIIVVRQSKHEYTIVTPSSPSITKESSIETQDIPQQFTVGLLKAIVDGLSFENSILQGIDGESKL